MNRDLDAVLRRGRAARICPPPHFALAHSMGGLISPARRARRPAPRFRAQWLPHRSDDRLRGPTRPVAAQRLPQSPRPSPHSASAAVAAQRRGARDHRARAIRRQRRLPATAPAFGAPTSRVATSLSQVFVSGPTYGWLCAGVPRRCARPPIPSSPPPSRVPTLIVTRRARARRCRCPPSSASPPNMRAANLARDSRSQATSLLMETDAIRAQFLCGVLTHSFPASAKLTTNDLPRRRLRKPMGPDQPLAETGGRLTRARQMTQAATEASVEQF